MYSWARNKGSLAATILDPKNKDLRAKVIKGVGKLLNREVKALCANKTPSMMQDTSGDALEQFSWELVWEEITKKAPTLVLLLQFSLPHKSKRDKKPVICMSVSMPAKYRTPKTCRLHCLSSFMLGMQVFRLVVIITDKLIFHSMTLYTYEITKVYDHPAS